MARLAPDAMAPAAWRAGPARPRRGASRSALQDTMFERLVMAFRKDLLCALQAEPPGPARHLRAYVRSVCDNALHRPRGQQQALLLLMQPCYQQIWTDFIDEACAHDTVDDDLLRQCRSAVEGLWFSQASLQARCHDLELQPLQQPQPFTGQRIAAVRDYLLSLCDAAPQPAGHAATHPQPTTRLSH